MHGHKTSKKKIIIVSVSSSNSKQSNPCSVKLSEKIRVSSLTWTPTQSWPIIRHSVVLFAGKYGQKPQDSRGSPGCLLIQSCSVHKSTYEYPQIFKNRKEKEEGKEDKDALDDPGRIPSQAKKNLFFITSRPALRPTQYPNNWVPVFIPGVQRTGHESLTTHLQLLPLVWRGQEILYLFLFDK